MYPKKANALFCEFEETGMNRQLGYSSPADLIDKYPTFFWNCISMHIEDGLKLLNLTASGRQWIANLHHHVLCAERSDRMMGPQLAEFTPDSHLANPRAQVPYILSRARQSPRPAAIPA